MFDTAPAAPSPALPRPPMPDRDRTQLEAFLVLRRNPLELWGPRAYRDAILPGSFLGRPQLMLNDPAAIRHVLVTNADNYGRNVGTRRVLAPIVGDGLFLAEGGGLAAPAPHHRPRHGAAQPGHPGASRAGRRGRYDRQAGPAGAPADRAAAPSAAAGTGHRRPIHVQPGAGCRCRPAPCAADGLRPELREGGPAGPAAAGACRNPAGPAAGGVPHPVAGFHRRADRSPRRPACRGGCAARPVRPAVDRAGSTDGCRVRPHPAGRRDRHHDRGRARDDRGDPVLGLLPAGPLSAVAGSTGRGKPRRRTMR